MINKFTRPNTLTAVYVPRPADDTIIGVYHNRFNALSKKELVDSYNKIEKIYGAHAQNIQLIVLHIHFQNNFNKSPFIVEGGIQIEKPIIVEGGVLIALGPKIHYSALTDSFSYLS